MRILLALALAVLHVRSAHTAEPPAAQPIAPSGLVAERQTAAGRPIDWLDWPWSAIGRVNRRVGGHCTGVLVAPDRVLTAAHCLWNGRTGRTLTPDAIHFVAGWRRGTALADRAVTRFILSPEWQGPSASPSASTADVAVLVLSAPIRTIAPIPVRPADVTDVDGRDAQLAVMRAGYPRERPHLLVLHGSCPVQDVRPSGVWLNRCASSPGDSGSPILLRGRDGFSVVAITAASTVDVDVPHGLSVAIPVQAMPSAIRAALGLAPPIE